MKTIVIVNSSENWKLLNVSHLHLLMDSRENKKVFFFPLEDKKAGVYILP